MTHDNATDRTHPVFDVFEAAGYRRGDLIDPARVDLAMLDEFEAMAGQTKGRVVTLDSHGIEAFEVGSQDVVTTGRSEPFDVGVEYTDSVVQPIGFAADHGLVNDDLGERFTGDGGEVTFFWGGDVRRDVPVLTPAEATRALGWWGHRGVVPKDTAEAMVAAVGGSLDRSVGRDDPDVAGEEIVRAPFVADAMAANADGAEQQSPDSGISGHDKRRRQRFYRNLEALEDAYGVDRRGE